MLCTPTYTHLAFILQNVPCRSTGSAETHTVYVSVAQTVLGPHACTASFPTLWVISRAHMFLLAHFLAQMKPGTTPSVHRATLFQSLHVRPPFPSGASVPLLKCVCPCSLELGFLIPSSKLGAGGGLDWHRATGGFFHGF